MINQNSKTCSATQNANIYKKIYKLFKIFLNFMYKHMQIQMLMLDSFKNSCKNNNVVIKQPKINHFGKKIKLFLIKK
jgi:hypothetical protein